MRHSNSELIEFCDCKVDADPHASDTQNAVFFNTQSHCKPKGTKRQIKGKNLTKVIYKRTTK